METPTFKSTGADANFSSVQSQIELASGVNVIMFQANAAAPNNMIFDNIKLACNAPVEPVAPVLVFADIASKTVKVGESIAISVEAFDEDGTISHIDFLDNDSLIHSEWAYPYEFDWTLASEGEHTLKAIAYDNDGNATEKTISVVAESVPSGNAFRKTNRNAAGIQTFKVYDVQGNFVTTLKSSTADLQRQLRKHGFQDGIYIVRGAGRFAIKTFVTK